MINKAADKESLKSIGTPKKFPIGESNPDLQSENLKS